MKTKLMAILLMAGGALLGETRVSIGVHIGPRPVPVVVSPYRPPCPGPGYVWVDGYYDPYRTWYPGYWAMPPYAGAYWVAPRFYGGHAYPGYWGGPRGHYYHHDYRIQSRPYRGGDHHERGRGYEREGSYRRGFRR